LKSEVPFKTIRAIAPPRCKQWLGSTATMCSSVRWRTRLMHRATQAPQPVQMPSSMTILVSRFYLTSRVVRASQVADEDSSGGLGSGLIRSPQTDLRFSSCRLKNGRRSLRLQKAYMPGKDMIAQAVRRIVQGAIA
jgi:hypothetical protein